MWKDVDKFTQNCCICQQHRLQDQSYSYMYIKAPYRQFDTIAFDLIGQLTTQTQRQLLLLICQWLLTNFPIAIPLPDKLAETVIQAYLHHIYATFGVPFILVTENNGWRI